MKEYKLSESEKRFADLIWDNEPIGSGELVRLSEKEFNWKKSTTYTVLKKLCERKIFQNKEAIVSSLIKREEYYRIKAGEFVNDTFGGSLPKFLTAFIGKSKLSKTEINEIKNLIDSHKEE